MSTRSQICFLLHCNEKMNQTDHSTSANGGERPKQRQKNKEPNPRGGTKQLVKRPLDGVGVAALFTSADRVGVAQDGALLDGAEGAEHHAHVVLGDLLRQHAHEQFPLCHQKKQTNKNTVHDAYFQMWQRCNLLMKGIKRKIKSFLNHFLFRRANLRRT